MKFEFLGEEDTAQTATKQRKMIREAAAKVLAPTEIYVFLSSDELNYSPSKFILRYFLAGLKWHTVLLPFEHALKLGIKKCRAKN